MSEQTDKWRHVALHVYSDGARIALLDACDRIKELEQALERANTLWDHESKRADHAEARCARLEDALKAARDELGVPQPELPRASH